MKISTDISVNTWNQFILDNPEGTIFQSPEMFELFQNTKKFEPLVLGAFDDKDELCGILLGVFIHEKGGIGKLLSSRFVIYGGPLLSGNEEEKKKSLDVLLKELICHTRRKALFIQFRNFFSWKEYKPVFEKHGFNLYDRLNYIIRLPVAGHRSPAMSSSRRRQIRKGLSSGAEIIEPENIDQVREFYSILYKLYRYKIRKPLPDWSFFENFYQLAIPTPHAPRLTPHIGIIRLIEYDGRVIGGILAPVSENSCIYEWYVCGLDKEYKEQHPSVLATWAAMDYAINNNISCFDFMGVGKPDMPYGVRDFKARFGGELVNYGRFTRINNSFLYNIAELGYNVLALLKKI